MITLLLHLALTTQLIPIQPQEYGQVQPIPQPFQGETPTEKWRDQMNTNNQMNEERIHNQDQLDRSLDRIYHHDD